MEFILLRIMKGRLPYRERGLSLYIEEPNQNLMYDSIEIYNDAFENAYLNGVMLKDEMDEFLFEQNIFTPFDNIELEKLKKENEDLKFAAYKNFLNKKELNRIKYSIRENEKKQMLIMNKKGQFSYLTCDGVASYCRWNWIIEHCTYYKDGSLYNWKDIDVSIMMSFYETSSIAVSDFRSIARSDIWRPIWNLGKKTGDLFGKPAYYMTKDQLLLCSFSSMYDNVYESSESPHEKIINDDDCLDGWFIEQKRNIEKHKKEQRINSLVDSKLSKSGEIFIVANSEEEIADIHSLNSAQANGNRIGRMKTISEKGVATDLDFADVKNELAMQSNQMTINTIRGKANGR